MEKLILWEFLYNDCIHESSYATISLHRTKEGAEKAMNAHKEEKRIEFGEYLKRSYEMLLKDVESGALDKEGFEILSNSLGNFDDHVDWQISEVEVLD